MAFKQKVGFAFLACIGSMILFTSNLYADTPSQSLQTTLQMSSSNQIDTQRLNYVDVVDTYEVFTGLLDNKAVSNVVVRKTYKSISFKTNYSQTASTLLRIEQIGGGGRYYPGHGWACPGSLEV